ncbi:MAG: lysophospholipid acyltransferase family protein [Proteobacteria bacterium]|nr:lysophospholipid acyltransferase family protein [Pseudomonadota bacterium]
MTRIIRSILIIKFLLLCINTLFFTILALLFFWSRYTSLNIDYYLMKAWGRTSTFIYGIKRERTNESRDKDFVGVYVAPHSSFWDIILLGSELRGFFVSKTEVVKWPIIGLGAKFVRTVFIDREKGVSALKSMEKSSQKIFNSGNSLIVFPEGTRSYEHMQPLKSGPFHVSFTTGRPIKPVIITYYPKESVVPRKKGNFIKELMIQSMSMQSAMAKINILESIKPQDFKSIDELKKHVFMVMDDYYK